MISHTDSLTQRETELEGEDGPIDNGDERE